MIVMLDRNKFHKFYSNWFGSNFFLLGCSRKFPHLKVPLKHLLPRNMAKKKSKENGPCCSQNFTPHFTRNSVEGRMPTTNVTWAKTHCFSLWTHSFINVFSSNNMLSDNYVLPNSYKFFTDDNICPKEWKTQSRHWQSSYCQE